MAPVQFKMPAASRSSGSIAPSLVLDSMRPGTAFAMVSTRDARNAGSPAITSPMTEKPTHRPANVANRPWLASPEAMSGPPETA